MKISHRCQFGICENLKGFEGRIETIGDVFVIAPNPKGFIYFFKCILAQKIKSDTNDTTHFTT